MNRFLLLTAGLSVAMSAMANWGNSVQDPVKVFPTSTSSYATEVKSAADGSVWAVIYHPNASKAEGETDIKNVVYEYRLQHFDADGNAEFADEGILLSDYRNISYTVVNSYLLVDKDGNAIVVVKDCRNSSGTSHSYTAYKVNPKGEMLWSEDGVAVSNPTRPASFSAFMSMVELEDGSYVFAWMETDSEGAPHVCMQRLSHDGVAQWDVDKVSMTDDVTAYPYLVNSGDNTFILVYGRTASTILYARKLDFEAESVWGKDVRIYRGGFGQTPIQTILNVTSSGDGGVLVGWTDDRTGVNIESAYLSYVTPDGKLGFAGSSDEGDAKLCYDNWRCFNVATVPAADGSAFYAIWRRTNNDQRYQGIMMQKVSKSGELLWGDEARELDPTDIGRSLGYVSIQQAGEDGACAFYEEYRSYFDQQCYAARFDKNGDYVWPSKIVAISEPDRKASNLESQPLGSTGSWLCNWTDGGTDADDKETTYLMTRFNQDGTFGIPGAAIGEVMTPREAEGLTYSDGVLSAAEDMEVKIYTPAGQLAAVCAVVDGCGRVTLPVGIYVALAADGSSLKFVVR